jgi:predicted Zn-dependent peptidase
MPKLDLRKSIPVHIKTLDNGLVVIIAERHKVPVVCLNIAYRVGSKDELHGKTGLAHLFEHLMFQGTENVPKGEFDRLCSMAGGVNNAYTTYDYTCYNMSLPAYQLELGLWLESDRLRKFSVTDEALLNQQKVVVEEISQTVDDQPYGKWRDVLAQSAYDPLCSYHWEIHGSKEHVANCSMGDVEEIFNNFYQPNNACMVLAGDVNPEETFTLVEKYFGSIPNLTKNKRRNDFKSEFLKGGIHATFDDSVPMPAVFLAYHCPGFMDDDIYMADMIANIYAGGKSSPFYKKLTYEKQIASYVGAMIEKKEHGSLIIFYAIANEAHITADILSQEMLACIEDTIKTGVTQSEFTKSINQMTIQYANSIQYSSGVADMLAQHMLFWNNPDKFYEILDKFNNLKIVDINEFARKILVGSNRIRIDALPNGN